MASNEVVKKKTVIYEFPTSNYLLQRYVLS